MIRDFIRNAISKTKRVDHQPAAATAGYEPGMIDTYFTNLRRLPPLNWLTMEEMLLDNMVSLSLGMRAGVIAGIEFAYPDGVEASGEPKYVQGIKADSLEVSEFVEQQLNTCFRNNIEALTNSQKYGWSAGECVHKTFDGMVEIDRLEERAPLDCRVLRTDGEFSGVLIKNVKNSQQKNGEVRLLFPYAFFIAHNPRPGEVYGRTQLIGAYPAWTDKNCEGGALDVRRLFCYSDAYGGRTLKYPNEMMQVGSEMIPARQVAQQIVEQIRSGGTVTLPSERDHEGNPKWELEQASIPSSPQHIMDAPKDCDAEIRRGCGVPDDVIDSDGSGGWAGKRVPLAAFGSSLDVWARSMYSALDQQIIRWMVDKNFGPDQQYEICHKPFAKQMMEQQSNAGEGTGPLPSAAGVAVGNVGTAAAPVPTQQMGLDLVDEVGQGLLEVSKVVRAAKMLIEDSDG